MADRPQLNVGSDYSSLGAAMGGVPQEAPEGNVVTWRPSAGAADQATADIITAQRVAVKRDIGRVIQEAQAISAAAGEKFYYRIPFKNRKTGATTYVEGSTIKCAMAAVNIYGNCRIEAFPAQETQGHWVFLARFTDLEKGVTVTRSFQQRKGQDTGMKDLERRMDMVFQIGQSKAMRNAVVGALGWLTDEMEAYAKRGIVERISKNIEGTRKWLIEQFESFDIVIDRVNRVIGRPAAKWMAPDMAKLFANLNAIKDGMADPDDLFPVDVEEAVDLAKANQDDEGKKTKARKAAKPVKPKDDAEPPTESEVTSESDGGDEPSAISDPVPEPEAEADVPIDPPPPKSAGPRPKRTPMDDTPEMDL